MYNGVRKIFRAYWTAYGGTTALIRSPYLHSAGFLLLLCFPIWSAPGWWAQVTDILPSLLGFTLGGFAMFLGFGSEKFLNTLTSAETSSAQGASAFVSLCATFVHFIVVQVVALIYALLAEAWSFPARWPDTIAWLQLPAALVGWGVGFGLFLYALLSTLAVTMHILRIARIFEAIHRATPKP